MAELPYLVKDLALILIVASIVTVLFKKLKQPLVLGYLVAGFLVSPHMPYIISVVDRADIQVWADIGVMFLLFSLGLDFSFKKILKMGLSPVIATCSIVFCMMMLGYVVGNAFGWGYMDCVFLGGMLAMSSTTIIYKAFDDMGLRQQRFANMVMSVLILEDMFAIVMMVMLSAIAGGGNPDGGQMLESVMRIGFFLILWFVVGIFVIPLLLRSLRKHINSETLLIISLGLCCAMAVISTQVGFSSAFGAFVMGSILAETIEADKIIKLVEPVKNLFGAVFFVSVGMLVDPTVLVEYALPIGVLILAILLGQSLFGSMGFLISGQSVKSAMQCGFSMAQIGEFSFIIASLGLSLGVISDFLYPVVVAVSVITTFLTPYMIRAATPSYSFVEKRMSPKLIGLLNDFTLGLQAGNMNANWKVLLVQMLRNTLIYSILSVAGIVLMYTFILPMLHGVLPGGWADVTGGVITLLLISPFLRAIIMKKNHSEEFKALWRESRYNRPLLILTIIVRLVIASAAVFYICGRMLHISGLLVAVVVAVIVVLMILSRPLKKRSIILERMFLLNLRSRDIEAQVMGQRRPLYEGRLLDRDIHIADFDVPENSKLAGMQLKELRLGSTFGIHISSILRGCRRINIPNGCSMILPGDELQVIGNDEQLSAFGVHLRENVYEEDPDIEKREMKLRQMVIKTDGPLCGKTLMNSGIRETYGCMVVGLEEGEQTLTQLSPSYEFKKGDVIWVVGEENALLRLEGR